MKNHIETITLIKAKQITLNKKMSSWGGQYFAE